MVLALVLACIAIGVSLLNYWFPICLLRLSFAFGIGLTWQYSHSHGRCWGRPPWFPAWWWRSPCAWSWSSPAGSRSYRLSRPCEINQSTLKEEHSWQEGQDSTSTDVRQARTVSSSHSRESNTNSFFHVCLKSHISFDYWPTQFEK